MKFNSSFRTVFRGLVCFAMLSACGKQRFEDKNTGYVATNLNQFLSLSQQDRTSIINQLGYNCGYTSMPTPVEGTGIIGATVLSSSDSSGTAEYWTEPRLCLPVCRIFPMGAGSVTEGTGVVETNMHIAIASLDGAVVQEELSNYYIGYCRPKGGCAIVSGSGTVSGSAGGSTGIAAGLSSGWDGSEPLSCYSPPVQRPIDPIMPMPYPAPTIPDVQ